MKKIAIIEDDLELKNLLEEYLNNLNNFECSIAVDSVEGFFEELNNGNSPEIIISDIGLPGLSGDEGLIKIKEALPEVEVVMLTVHQDDEKIFKCLKNGASGYILKNAPLSEIKDYIDILSSGGAPMSPQIARKVVDFFQPKKSLENPLTDREYDIVNGLVDGLSYKLIASKLNISLDTVRQHIRNVYRKLSVNSKAEVIAKKYRGEI